MAITIRLLSTYNGYKPQSIITVEDAIANQLIAGLNATTDLTGGTQAFQPAPNADVSTGSKVPAAQTLTAGQSATLVVPAGLSLSMQGTPTVAGTRQVLNPDNSVVSTTALGPGLDNTGVFLRDTKVKFSVTFGTLDITADVTGGQVELGTLLAGERPEYDWQAYEAGAIEPGGTILPGRVDQMVGTLAAPGDYLKRINAVVSATTDSRVVLKEGNPLPKKLLYTHGATASTVSQINTANNPDAVVADQYKDHLVRAGTGPYRKILTHPAFNAGAVNQYNLDQPLDVAPAINQAVVIEDPNLAVEILPVGAPVGTHPLPIERPSRGEGWRLGTGKTVHCVPTGDFENV